MRGGNRRAHTVRARNTGTRRHAGAQRRGCPLTACCLLRLFRCLLVETDGLVGDWSRFCISPQSEWCRPASDWRSSGHRLVTGRGWWLRVGGSAPGSRRNSLEFRFQLVGGRSKPLLCKLGPELGSARCLYGSEWAPGRFPISSCRLRGTATEAVQDIDSAGDSTTARFSALCLGLSLQKRCAVVVPTKSLPQIC